MEKLYLALKRLNEQGYYWSVVENTTAFDAFDSGFSATPLSGKWLIIWVNDYPDEVLMELADLTESRPKKFDPNSAMEYIYCVEFNNN
jgi:hypothetical protein